MSETYPKIKAVGDSTILVEYEQVISLEVNLKVRRLAHALEKHPFVGMREVVPAYRALMVFFDPLAVEFFDEKHGGMEDRFLLLGVSAKLRILMVCYCLREAGNVIRIISARKATRSERRDYESKR